MDNKSKFFKNALLFQFIAVLLLGIFIISNFREQKILNIRGFHPYEFNYAHAAPLVFFGAAVLLSLLSLIFKQKEVEQDEAEELKIKRRQNFWKFAFYCNLFLLVVIAVFSIALSRKNPFVIDQPVLFYSLIFSRSLLVLIISLVAASFLLAVGINWKTNKAIAVTILIFSFFIFSISFVCEVMFISKFMEASESYIAAKNEKKTLVNEDEQLGDYDGNDEYEEGEENEYAREDLEEQKNNLILSVDSLLTAWKGFDGKIDFYNRRILVSNALKHKYSESEYLALRYIDDVREDPEMLTSGFNMYKSIFYNAFSKEAYYSSNLDKVVEGLLLVYSDIGRNTDKLDEIYAIMIEPDRKYISELESYCSPQTVSALQHYKFDDSNAFFIEDRDWFYSFWARRNHEGNAKETAAILREIKNHYN